MAWAPLGACQAVDIEADLDDKGEIIGWRHDVWGNGHVSRPGRGKTPTLQAAWQLERPFPRLVAINPPLAGGGGSERNAVPLYDSRPGASPIIACSRCRCARPRCGRWARSPTCSPSSRSWTSWPPRAARTVAFRLRHLKDPRARAVLEAAAGRAGWSAMAERTASATASASRATRCRRLLRRRRRGRERCRVRVRRLVSRSCWRGHQARWRHEPDRRRRHPGDELDAEGGGSLRPRAHDQRQLGALSDPAFLRSAARWTSSSSTIRISRRLAQAKHRKDPQPPPLPTPSSTRWASACATYRSPGADHRRHGHEA